MAFVDSESSAQAFVPAMHLSQSGRQSSHIQRTFKPPGGCCIEKRSARRESVENPKSLLRKRQREIVRPAVSLNDADLLSLLRFLFHLLQKTGKH
jgi:hypothetical protein